MTLDQHQEPEASQQSGQSENEQDNNQDDVIKAEGMKTEDTENLGVNSDQPTNTNENNSIPLDEQLQIVNEQLMMAKKEIDELKDNWTYERAEFQNYRKRSVQEGNKSQQVIVCRIAQQLLPVLDDLDSMVHMKSEHPETQSYIKGVALIQESFFSILAANHIHRLTPTSNSIFDPQTMEALANKTTNSDEEETSYLQGQEDVVVEVFQAGFLYQRSDTEETKQVIRPARVRVGKSESKQNEAQKKQGGQ